MSCSPAKKAFRQRNLAESEESFEILAAFDFQIAQMTEYHFRINGRLDVWPSGKRWYDIETKEKGSYADLVDFVRDRFSVCNK